VLRCSRQLERSERSVDVGRPARTVAMLGGSTCTIASRACVGPMPEGSAIRPDNAQPASKLASTAAEAIRHVSRDMVRSEGPDCILVQGARGSRKVFRCLPRGGGIYLKLQDRSTNQPTAALRRHRAIQSCDSPLSGARISQCGLRLWVEPWQSIRRICHLLAVIRTDVAGLLAHATDGHCRVCVQVTGGLEPHNLCERNQPAKRRASRGPL
jgi:hypothetical protein